MAISCGVRHNEENIVTLSFHPVNQWHLPPCGITRVQGHVVIQVGHGNIPPEGPSTLAHGRNPSLQSVESPLRVRSRILFGPIQDLLVIADEKSSTTDDKKKILILPRKD
ncbi:uncharacterized protein LOC142221798 [Haematobia irritans]|uniref:uncharacterized protein LOC142221798 n=1 Tax=Haematobia irritans TaxID=7368 RepID=UPI003F504B03